MNVNLTKTQNEYRIKKFIFLFSIVIQIVFFILYLNKGNVYCDEAMTILNARTIADKGTDIMGTQLPVYFNSWIIGGQSPFATYIIALFIKIFGYSLAITRIPMLIIQTLATFSLYKLAKEMFNDEKYAIVIFSLAAMSPWKLIQSNWTLDCEFLPCFIIFGLLFLSKAMNGKKCSLNYTLSMIFFGLGFYCYIASVLIIPILLVSVYLLMMIKKQIKFKYVLLSVGVIFIVALPFILFGLINTGILDSFTLFGFSFPKMDGYERAKDVVFSENGIGNIISIGFTNIVFAFMMMCVPDASLALVGNVGMEYKNFNIFLYAHTLGGIITVLSIIIFVFSLILKKCKYSMHTKILLASSVISICFYFFSVSNCDIGILYRYSIIYYVLFIFEGMIIVKIAKKFTKLPVLKVILPLLLICSLIMTSFEFINSYNTNSYYYGNAIKESIAYAKQNTDNGEIIFINSLKGNGNIHLSQGTFIHFYHYDDVDYMMSYSDEFTARKLLSKEKEPKDIIITTDGKWKYENATNIPLDKGCYIVSDFMMQYINYDKTQYNTKKFEYYNVIYRK